MNNTNTHASRLAGQTRFYRRLHKWIAVPALFFLLLISLTGLLLTWKKNSGGLLLAESRKGSSTEMADWLPLDSIARAALSYLRQQDPAMAGAAIDRIDVRPDKGMAKVTIRDSYLAVQMDLATGRPLLLEKRRADFIEHLHDGTIIDRLTGLAAGKLNYSTLAGLSLLLLSVSGFWLWINPGRIRKLKKSGD